MKRMMLMTVLILITALMLSGAAAFAGEADTDKNLADCILQIMVSCETDIAEAYASIKDQAKSEMPAGEEEAERDILLGVPKLSTQDKRWKNYSYDKGAKIGKYGCLLVSCTAVLSEVDGEEYRPDKLSEKFRFNDGYMQWGKGWGKRFEPNVKYSLKTIRRELKEGNPVIVHGYSKKYGHHYAVITGMKGEGTKTSQFTVMDPSFSKTKTLNQFFKTFSSKKSLVLVEK